MAVAFRDTSLPITMAGKNYVMKYLDFQGWQFTPKDGLYLARKGFLASCQK